MKYFPLFCLLIVALAVLGAGINLENLEPRQFATNGVPPHVVFYKGSSGDNPGSVINVYNIYNYVINTNVYQEFLSTTNYYDNSQVIYTNTYLTFDVTTNVYNNSYVTNINTTIINTNVTTINTNTFITNVNTTIYNTNVYQTFVSSTNYYESVTNIYNKAVSYHTNSTIVLSNSYITINGTNVATVNETDGYVPYRLSSTNFTDSYFYRIVNGMGIDTNLFFGPGVTNYIIKSGGGILAAGGNAIDLLDLSTSKSLRFGSSAFFPLDAAIDLGYGPGGGAYPWRDFKISGEMQIQGYYNGFDYSYASFKHQGTNSTILLSSKSAGIAGVPRPFEIDRNLGATLAVGDTTFVDMFQASATNALSGDLTFAYATNGLDLVEFTHVRTFFNPEATNCTINLPGGWHKGTGAAAAVIVPSGTIAELYVKSKGPTGSSALQTNVFVSALFYP